MIKPSAAYEDNKTYPILVSIGGYRRIVEMSGLHVNAYNRVVQLYITIELSTKPQHHKWTIYDRRT